MGQRNRLNCIVYTSILSVVLFTGALSIPGFSPQSNEVIDDSIQEFTFGLVQLSSASSVNTPPIVDAGLDPAAFDQGGTFSSTGSFTDPDADTWMGTVNWGDGTPEEALALALPAKTFSLSHTYTQDIFTLNDGSPFEVIVTINDGTVDSTDIVLVTVNNVSPTIAPIADATIDQGDLFSTMGSFADPDDDVWTAYVNFEGTQPTDEDSDGDGINDVDEGIPSDAFPTCLETDPQDRDTDDDGLTDGEEVFIFSTDPCTTTGSVVTPDDSDGDGINDVDEDTGTSLPQYPLCETDSQVRDTDSDGLTDGEEVLIFGSNPCDEDTDGDGTNDADETKLGINDENVVLEPDKTFELEHTFLKSGVFTSVFSISDGPFDPIEEEFIVTVNNIAPTLVPGTGDTINEGDTFSTSGSFTDPGDDPWEVIVNYGDGTGDESIAFDETAPPTTTRTFELSHVYTNDGTFMVTVTVDDGTASDSASFDVFVNNVVPMLELGDDVAIDEGDEFFSFGRVTDPGTEIFDMPTVDYDDGAGPVALDIVDNTFELEHTYEDDGTFTVTVTVNDGSGPVTEMVMVIVSNVAPDISLGMSEVDGDRKLTAPGSFTDPGADTWTGTVDWGDGTPEEALVFTGKTFSPMHTYAENGAYTVTFQVTDDDGGVGSESPLIGVVVSDTEPLPELNLPPASLTSFSNNVLFQKFDQNMWPGTSGMKQWDVFPEQRWNERGSDRDIRTLGVSSFGGSIGGSTNGLLKSFARATELQGTADINYPGSLEVEHAAPKSFLAGQDVPIKPKWTLDTSPSGASINNAKTLGNLELFLRLDIFAGFDTLICIFGCFDIFGFIPDVNFDTGNVELFDFNVADTVTNIPPPKLSGHLLGPVDPMFGPISVSPVTTTKDPNTGRIVATDKNTFSSMNLDLDAIASGGTTSLKEVVVTEVKEAIGVTLEHEVLDAKSPIDFIAEQTLTFDTDILVKFDFVPPVAGVMGSTVLVEGNEVDGISSITTMKGEQIAVKFPLGQTEPTTVTTTVSLDPTKTKLHNLATVGTMSQIDTTMLSADIGIPRFNITPSIPIYDPIPHLSGWECHGFLCFGGHFHHGPHWHIVDRIPALNFPGVSFGIGPLFEFGPFAELMTTVEVSDRTIPLDVTGDVTTLSTTFLLIPEIPPTADADGPYTVNEGSIVRLDGSGSTDDGSPQPLTHNWDLDDNGTFETNGVSVDFLGVDGPDFPKVTIKVFDGLNSDTDFSNVLVVNVNPTVSAGNDQEVVIHDLVNLDPAQFTDPGFDCTECNPVTFEDFTGIVDWGDNTGTKPLIIDETPGSPGILTQGTASGSHMYRLPGVYTVTVTVDDDDSGSTSDTLITTVLGARDLKNRVISMLMPFESDSDDVEEAIEAIRDSLELELWEDDVNLNPGDGGTVFDEEKSAVDELQKITKSDDDDDEPVSDELKEVAQFGIDTLVNADRVLAITAMLKGTSTPVEDPENQDKVDEENEKSAKEFARGDKMRDKGKPEKAIDQYEKAWDHAQNAIKAAEENDEDDDDDGDDESDYDGGDYGRDDDKPTCFLFWCW